MLEVAEEVGADIWSLEQANSLATLLDLPNLQRLGLPFMIAQVTLAHQFSQFFLLFGWEYLEFRWFALDCLISRRENWGDSYGSFMEPAP